MSEKRRRNKILVVRLSDDEYDEVKRRANGNVSDFIRRSIFGVHRVTWTHPFNSFSASGPVVRQLPSNGHPQYTVGI